MSLTNPNTPVSQQDLKDLYEQKILPYIGGAFGLVATGIDSSNLYSTTERVVGQWIDRKPLYQKTINAGSYTNAGSTVEIDIGANVDRIIKVDFFGESASGGFWPVPYVDWQNMDNQIEFWGSGVGSISGHRYIKFRSKVAYANGTFYVTVQYTKTTDSAVESYGTDTTYSTDEHVVGSWIDGKPVYQKTFTGTSGGNGTDATFGSISNAETIVSLRGIVRNSNNMMHGAPNPGLYLKYYNGNIQTYTSDAQFGNQPCSITVQYTKSS